MLLLRSVAPVLAVLVALVGCGRNPDVAKKRYLESGNKYFAKGKYREARLMYKDALQKDQRYGPAYYKLGLTAIKLGTPVEAVQALRRAVELLPEAQNEHWDAAVKLSEIYLTVAREQKQYIDEVEKYCSGLLKRDANSFDGHRLTGDLDFARSIEALKTAEREQSRALLDSALEEYERANQIEPGHQGVLMQLARVYAATSNNARAEQYYRQVLDKNKSFQPAYIELYRLYAYQRKFQDGEALLKSAFAANPKEFAYLTSLALHYSMQGRREDMASTLQQIKWHAKEYADAFLVVGDFYLRLGDGESAIREYRDGMLKDPGKKTVYQKRVIEVLMRQGKRAEAADLNSQILKQDPNDTDAKGLAATFLLDKGDVARAISDLQAVVTRAPENPVARYNLGRAHAARGEWEQARQMFQKAIELRPDYIMARLALAQLQVTRGEYDAALRTAEQALQIDRGNLNARLIESAALMGQKKFADSRGLLEQMLKANPGSPDVYFQLGVVNLSESKYKEAEAAFQKSYELNPANPRGLMGVVETEMAQDKPDAALKIMKAEADRSPSQVDLRISLGNLSVRAGRYDNAIADYQQALNSLDKNSKMRGDLYLRIGETYRRKGDSQNALAALQKAREILPDNALVLSTLALVLDQSGRWPEAKLVYEAALKFGSDNGAVLNNIAFLIADHGGDLDDALTKAQRAKQLLPNLNEVSDTLGWIYLKKNLSDNAIEIFKDLVQKAPNQSTFRYHLGLALSQKGDKPRALKELQEALKHDPPKVERDKIQELLNRLGAA